MLRWLPFWAISAVLFAIALNGEVYDVTSPPQLGDIHVVIRKLYSVVAFAVVGAAYALGRRRRISPLDAALAIALYSGSIEIGQWFVTDEQLGWNLFDVACGFVGGGLGAIVYRWLKAATTRWQG